MQIVIDLTDEMYQAVKDGMWCGNELSTFGTRTAGTIPVANGIAVLSWKNRG